MLKCYKCCIVRHNISILQSKRWILSFSLCSTALSHAVSFNRALDVCKLTGAVLFCVGGTSMAVGFLLSAFAKSYSKEELYLQHKFKERLGTVGKLASLRLGCCWQSCFTHVGFRVLMQCKDCCDIYIYISQQSLHCISTLNPT